MNILAVGTDGRQKTVLADYLSATYTQWGWQADEAEVVIPAGQISQAAAPSGRSVYNLRGWPAHDLLLVFGDDATAMRLVKATITSDNESQAAATARLMCRQPTHTAPRRIIIPPAGSAHDSFSGAAESTCKHYVDTQIVNPTDADRAVANFAVAADTADGRTVAVDGRYQDLAAVLDETGQVGGVGHTVFYSDGLFYFDATGGANRTATVVVSIAQGTATGEELLSDIDQAVNHAYVGGQGEGAARTIQQANRGLEKQGWQRNETWVDARDTNDAAVLTDRGLADLQEAEQATDVEVDSDKLGTFELMDLVRYQNTYGLDKTARIVGVTRTFETSKVPDVTVHLDQPWPDVDRSRSALSGAEIQ